MHDQPNAPYPALTTRSSVYVADGYGVKISVERGHLHVKDGLGAQRRHAIFSRAEPGIKRLILFGHTGFVTLEAFRWLADLGIALVHLDADGRILATQAPAAPDDARLRRAQSLAITNGIDLEIARYLVDAKLQGQLRVIETRDERPGVAISELQRCIDAVPAASSTVSIRSIEAQGAIAYWGAWSGLTFPFARRDASKVPGHWLAFETRVSPITGQPRKSADPFNSLLNYLYSLLEAEARIACVAIGLDPGIGVVHADIVNRDSMALDLMEPVRPAVDAYVLELATSRVFSARGFHETRQGVCRVLPPLTHHLAETVTEWRRLLAPVAEQVASMLAAGPGSKIRKLPTRLTQANRKAGQEQARRRDALPRVASATRPPNACAECGMSLAGLDRKLCEACLPDERAQHVEQMLEKSLVAKARHRAEGVDPERAAETKRRLSETMRERRRRISAWAAENEVTADPDVFRREILPRLQAATIRQLMRATGLSSLYCSRIRSGERFRIPCTGTHYDRRRYLS